MKAACLKAVTTHHGVQKTGWHVQPARYDDRAKVLIGLEVKDRQPVDVKDGRVARQEQHHVLAVVAPQLRQTNKRTVSKRVNPRYTNAIRQTNKERCQIGLFQEIQRKPTIYPFSHVCEQQLSNGVR
jgi:hypothetical protein